MAAALAENGGIGYKNGLPWSIPGDWKFFETITSKPYNKGFGDSHIPDDTTTWSNVVILGRGSYESRPMLRVPLFHRYNVIVSRSPDYQIAPSPIAELVPSLDQAFDLASRIVREDGRIFVLGGEQIYRQSILLPECTHVLLTNVYSSKHIPCDTFIPEIDPHVFRLATHEKLEEFLQEEVPKGRQTHEHFQYEFVLYLRNE
ncbi:dihydrofolate reductase-like domain-containing protein [Parasitella parasitica]|nr:dihydrofolate reductase-like domain-containing protein [Parasitella parasitica]